MNEKRSDSGAHTQKNKEESFSDPVCFPASCYLTAKTATACLLL